METLNLGANRFHHLFSDFAVELKMFLVELHYIKFFLESHTSPNLRREKIHKCTERRGVFATSYTQLAFVYLKPAMESPKQCVKSA